MPYNRYMVDWQQYRERRYFGSLDGIRAVAILAVLWHHTVNWRDMEWLPAAGRGFLGVDLFFVLSGFLIVTLMLRERERNGDISLKKFYMRRTLRIFPVYYALLIGLSILFYIIAPGSEKMLTIDLAYLPDWVRNIRLSVGESVIAADFRTWVANYFTYTSNWVRHDESTLLAVTWSLATEEQFYLIYPPIEKWLKRFALPIMAVTIGISQLINYKLIFRDAHADLEILQSTFTPICFGVLLAYLLHNERGFNITNKLLGYKFIPLILLGVLAFVINYPFPPDISGTPRLIVHILMTVFTAAVVIREDHWLRPVLTWKPFVRIGAISYGMYLFHMFVKYVVDAGLARVGVDVPLLPFLAVLVGTLIVAEISFRFLEEPFLKLKKRFSSH